MCPIATNAGPHTNLLSCERRPDPAVSGGRSHLDTIERQKNVCWENGLVNKELPQSQPSQYSSYLRV